MKTIDAITRAEENPRFHMSRLIILISAFDGHISGLSKLANLDFLLRYPAHAKAVLEHRHRSVSGMQILDHEMANIENGAVMYKYGPWDFRYKALLVSMAALNTIKLSMADRAVSISLLEQGSCIANHLRNSPHWATVCARSEILHRHCNITGNALSHAILKACPSLTDIPLGGPIR